MTTLTLCCMETHGEAEVGHEIDLGLNPHALGYVCIEVMERWTLGTSVWEFLIANYFYPNVFCAHTTQKCAHFSLCIHYSDFQKKFPQTYINSNCCQ